MWLMLKMFTESLSDREHPLRSDRCGCQLHASAGHAVAEPEDPGTTALQLDDPELMAVPRPLIHRAVSRRHQNTLLARVPGA
jgi:hypothetical protein